MKEGWTYKKLGEVCDVSAGQGAPQGEENYCEDGIPFVKAGNVEELLNGLNENNIQKVNEAVAKSHKLKLYRAGSVVFAKSGMSCMKGLVYTLKNDCYVVSHLAILTPKEVLSSFLNYTLNYFKPNTLVKDEAYPSISLGDISQFSIPVPPIETQSRIVSELDLLQSLIDKQQAQLKELDNLAQSIFYDMFGDPVENDKGWEVKQICDVCLPKKEIKRATKQFDKDDEISYIDISAIDNSKNVITTPTSLRFGDAPSRAQQTVIKNDILISLVRPNLNNVALVSMDSSNLVASSGFCVLRASRDVEPLFLFAIVKMKDFTDYLMQRVSGANYPAVREEDITGYKTIIPPLSLQQSFAEKIEAIEKQKANISKSIEETQKLFDYTMDKYFG